MTRAAALFELLLLPDPPEMPIRSHRWTQEGESDQVREALKTQLARSFRAYRQQELRTT